MLQCFGQRQRKHPWNEWSSHQRNQNWPDAYDGEDCDATAASFSSGSSGWWVLRARVVRRLANERDANQSIRYDCAYNLQRNTTFLTSQWRQKRGIGRKEEGRTSQPRAKMMAARHLQTLGSHQFFFCASSGFAPWQLSGTGKDQPGDSQNQTQPEEPKAEPHVGKSVHRAANHQPRAATMLLLQMRRPQGILNLDT